MKVFIYGTLKRGHCRCGSIQDQKYLGDVNTSPKYDLYDCGDYPALVDGGETSIHGELWEVDEECKLLLDAIECAPYLYQLKRVELCRFLYKVEDSIANPEEKAIVANNVDIVDWDDVYTYFYQLDTKDLKLCGPTWEGL